MANAERAAQSVDDTPERLMPTREDLPEVLRRYPDHRQRYDLALGYAEGKKVADIACGAGYGSYMLGTVARAVVGFEVDALALDHARAHFAGDRVRFRHASEIGEERFDLIVSLETIEHMTEADGDLFLRRLGRALRPDGLLLISTPLNTSDHRVDVTTFHLREYDDVEFANKLTSNGFVVRHRFGQGLRTLMQPVVGGWSLGSLMRSGLHRLLPARLRRPLASWLLKPRAGGVEDPCCILRDQLVGASVQIALCSPAPSDGTVAGSSTQVPTISEGVLPGETSR